MGNEGMGWIGMDWDGMVRTDDFGLSQIDIGGGSEFRNNKSDQNVLGWLDYH